MANKNKEDLAKWRKSDKAVMIKELKEAEKALGELIFSKNMGKIKNVREARLLKRKIARLKTILTERNHG